MNRIKDLREDKDLKQIEIANLLHIKQQTLSDYETEKTEPSKDL